MIKLLINSFFIIFLVSCEEIRNNDVTLKVNNGIKKIEEIVEHKEKKNQISNKQFKKEQSIFYYLEDPYYIEGVKYTPEENYNYTEVGISTFYGKELHNVKTINNDLNKVTELLGRHKTLPLPSMVKVTNLDNGLSVIIKIVDRHDDNTSLIQVSRKVAQLLGFYKDKIATVRVDILSDASKQWKNVSLSLNEPAFNDTISSAPTEEVSISDIDISEDLNKKNNKDESEPIELLSEEIKNYNLFLKVFKFKNYQDIQTVMDSLNQDIKYTSQKNGSNFELILGPIKKNEMNNLVSYFISKGYKETKIILN